jgi:uncharacterized protein YjbI with pentapeptide repeats
MMKVHGLLFALLLPLGSGFTPLHRHTDMNKAAGVPVAIAAVGVGFKTIPEPEHNNNHNNWQKLVATSLLGLSLVVMTTASSPAAFAADYANMDISGKDFSDGNYANQDFTQVIAKGTNFHNSNLQGSLFSKANLVNADFSGADLRGASLEETILDGVLLKNANAQGARFSASILDVDSFENVDLTDSNWPSVIHIMLCDRTDLKGTNPATGVDARESIFCAPM